MSKTLSVNRQKCAKKHQGAVGFRPGGHFLHRQVALKNKFVLPYGILLGTIPGSKILILFRKQVSDGVPDGEVSHG